MSSYQWQKSSYCGQGESCVHVAARHGAVHVTESSDPTGAIIHTTPAAWAALVRSVKTIPSHG
ncbi:DUF397 domain-containing protein [Streptomyces sp. NPDC004980]